MEKRQKTSLIVEKFTMTTNGATADAEPKGTVIHSSVVDRKDVHEIDGKAVDRTVAQALDMVVSLSHGAPTDDEILGTKDRKKKGDSWDVNAGKARAAMESSADGAEISNITGKTTLADVTGDSLEITAHLTGSVKPPLPPSVTVDQGSMEVDFAGAFPIDPAKCQSKDTQIFSLSNHRPCGHPGEREDGDEKRPGADHRSHKDAGEVIRALEKSSRLQMQVRILPVGKSPPRICKVGQRKW